MIFQAQSQLTPLLQRMQDFIPSFANRLTNLAKAQPTQAEDIQAQIILALRGYADNVDMLLPIVSTLLPTVADQVLYPDITPSLTIHPLSHST